MIAVSLPVCHWNYEVARAYSVFIVSQVWRGVYVMKVIVKLTFLIGLSHIVGCSADTPQSVCAANADNPENVRGVAAMGRDSFIKVCVDFLEKQEK